MKVRLRGPRFVLTMLLALVAIDAVAAKMKVKVNRDQDFDFRAVKTWAWSDSGPGVVKMKRTADDDSEGVQRRLEPTIVDAVARELGRAGLTPAADGPADVTVTYYLLVTLGTNAQQLGEFLPTVPEWGLPPFAPATTSYRVVQQGSMVIDAASPQLKQVIWRGVAQAEIDEARSEEERRARIQEAVRELIRRFPRK